MSERGEGKGECARERPSVNSLIRPNDFAESKMLGCEGSKLAFLRLLKVGTTGTGRERERVLIMRITSDSSYGCSSQE